MGELSDKAQMGQPRREPPLHVGRNMRFPNVSTQSDASDEDQWVFQLPQLAASK